ncbi:MAG: hypothetical protein IIB31_07900 [Chloroflexi bacterium]|nr:hypothetical protein [Chloroflexota bacterium]MCH8897102.1 hypothetical protein [Chloroflexota bacterium]
MPEKTIEEVLSENTFRLMSLPGVVGTGLGECDGEACIRVLVIEKSSAVLGKIPSSIDGFKVDVQQTRVFKALDQR